jgi:hypothetical protein
VFLVYILEDDMVDYDLLDQLLASMDEAVGKLEIASAGTDKGYAQRLRVFIFDVSKRIDSVLANVGVGNV